MITKFRKSHMGAYLSLSIILMMAGGQTSTAQPAGWISPQLVWQHTYGGSAMDVAKKVQPTTDGGFIMIGSTASNDSDVTVNNGLTDVWVIKLDSVGAMEWQQTYGGSSSDSGESVQQTFDGGYIVGAITYSSDSGITGNHGNSDYWILKIDSAGAVQWSKVYGGSGYDDLRAIKQTRDSGFVVCGASNSNDFDVTGNHGLHDYWMLRLNEVGDISSSKCFGGSGDDYGTDILQAVGIGGNLVMAGYSNSNDGDLTGNIGGFDYWVLKIEVPTDTIIWQTNLGGTYDEMAYAITQNEAQGFTIVGGSNSNDSGLVSGHVGKPGPTGSFDLWIVKLSYYGVKFWENSIGGYGDEYGYDVVQNHVDSGFTVVCSSNSQTWYGAPNIGATDLYIFRIRYNGHVDYGRVYGGTNDDFGYGVALMPSEELIVAGGTFSSDSDVTVNKGMCDAWVVKLGAPVNLAINEYTPYNNGLVSVHPNPFNSTAIISINTGAFSGKKNILNIYNMQGQMVRSYQAGDQSTITLDKNFFTSGLFYYQLESDGTVVSSGKLIAQ